MSSGNDSVALRDATRDSLSYAKALLRQGFGFFEIFNERSHATIDRPFRETALS